MGNSKIYWLIIVSSLFSTVVFAEKDLPDYCYYCNHDMVINSATIGDGRMIEYSLFYLQSVHHFKYTIEKDSTHAFQIGIGNGFPYYYLSNNDIEELITYPMGSLPFIANLNFSYAYQLQSDYKNPLRLQVNFGVGSSYLGMFQASLIKSKKLNNTIELGTTYTLGVSGYPLTAMSMQRIFEHSTKKKMECYFTPNPMAYLKTDIHGLKTINENLAFGVGLGLTAGYMLATPADGFGGLSVAVQYGLTLQYHLGDKK